MELALSMVGIAWSSLMCNKFFIGLGNGLHVYLSRDKCMKKWNLQTGPGTFLKNATLYS